MISKIGNITFEYFRTEFFNRYIIETFTYSIGQKYAKKHFSKEAKEEVSEILENVKIAFQTRYRCWDNGASDDSEKCLVEISRDGINWPDINTFSELDGGVDYGNGVIVPSRWEVFPGYETGSQTDNPSFVDFDISSAAGLQEEVWIRFRWSRRPLRLTDGRTSSQVQRQ